ncbi:MAG: flagellar biosynthesis protein FlhB [Methylocystis sp.]|nr:MAG: flagellar biosynthesis protein FlhB [Methylocystis sp.]
MSDTEDADSKTEEATEKKIQDTLAEGKTAVSRDVGAAFGAFALLGALTFLTEDRTPGLTETMSLMLVNAGALSLRTDGDALRYLGVVGEVAGRYVAPSLLLFMAIGLAASFVQGVPAIIFDRIQPDLSRISPGAGWSRIFSVAGAIELLKTVAKIVIVGGAVTLAAASDLGVYIDAMRMAPGRLPSFILRLLIHLAGVVSCALAVIALADFAWTKFKWRRDLRMSRQELKDEFKQAEGDPLVKARMRSLAMERSRRRMMASIPEASFVVVNPTHYAIALRYVREEGGAPLVLAKGKDLVALKIREIAEKNGVPVLERKDLARAMFDLVEVNVMIPSEFYRPVAELIHFLHETAARRHY